DHAGIARYQRTATVVPIERIVGRVGPAEGQVGYIQVVVAGVVYGEGGRGRVPDRDAAGIEWNRRGRDDRERGRAARLRHDGFGAPTRVGSIAHELEAGAVTRIERVRRVVV